MKKILLICILSMPVMSYPCYGKDNIFPMIVEECKKTYMSDKIDSKYKEFLVEECIKATTDLLDKLPLNALPEVYNKTSAIKYALAFAQKIKTIIPYDNGEGVITNVFFDQKQKAMNFIFEVALKEDETFVISDDVRKFHYQALCVTPVFQKLKEYGIIMKYSFKSSTGEGFGNITIKKEDCDQL